MITKMLLAKGVLAGAVILANTPTDGGCAAPPAGGGGGARPAACHLFVKRNPALSRNPDRVSATIHADCLQPYPTQHILTVWLWREVGGPGGGAEGWVPIGDQKKEVTIPDESGFDITVTAACTSVRTTNRWRVGAKVKGVDGSGAPINASLSESDGHPTAIQCK